MMVCTFYGSYYDPSPWTEQACMVENAVPAGCPIHFITAANVAAADIQVMGGSGATPSTATLVDTQVVPLDTVDVFSCNCDPATYATTFQRFAVTAPSLAPGDYATITWPGASGPAMSVLVQDPGACAPVEWPTTIEANLACDRCPADPIGSDDAGSGSGSSGSDTVRPMHGGGCAAGGDASLGALVAVLAVSGMGRRRRRRTSARQAR
jgi:hypothetical protein